MEIDWIEDRLILSGVLQAGELAEQRRELERVSSEGPLEIEMGGLDIEDGASMSFLASWIKRLLRRNTEVAVIGAPQLLIHNLYRIGYHPHAGLHVREMRRDEPTA
jgi:ABC-type transporter Mla MlaB component